MNRAGDKVNVGSTILGFLLVAAAVFLRAERNLETTPFVVMLVLGCLAIAPSIFIDLARKWLGRGNGGSSAPPTP